MVLNQETWQQAEGLLPPEILKHYKNGEYSNPIVEWNKSTGLRPVLDTLAEPERDQFLAEYAARMAAAYPKRADGRTFFPFRRLFMVGVRK